MAYNALRKMREINMQMDIDRLCLERSIECFMETGIAEDAFSVYFCYLEMFIARYGKSRRMIELLSEFETNSSSLLMKHRDYYSHSVYVEVCWKQRLYIQQNVYLSKKRTNIPKRICKQLPMKTLSRLLYM